jgi:periplasmic protein CpxP/Spy
MKTSHKLTLTLAGLLLLASPLVCAADEPASPPTGDKPRHEGHGGPGAMMERAAKELNLTPDQQTKWQEIGKQERAALEPLRDDTSLSREDRRAKAMEINKSFATQRRALLNPEQQAKFDELIAKMREHRGGGPGGGPGTDQGAPKTN